MNISKETITTIVYDGDYTLWDPDFGKSCKLVASHLGVPRKYEKIFAKNLGHSLLKLIDLTSNNVITPELLAKHLDTLMHDILQTCNVRAIDVIQTVRNPDFACCNVKSDALDTVMYLWKNNYKQILKSNWWAEVQIVQLRKFGLYPYFESVHGPLWSYFKPHPEAAKKFLSGLNPDHFLMVGDCLELDILFAKNTGMKSVWLNPSGVKNTTTITPDITIRKLSDLMDIL